MKYAKTFTVKGNIERAFDLTEKYVQGMKFSIKNAIKPTLLVAERGSRSASAFGFAGGHKIENCKTVLAISFNQIHEDVSVLCDYDVTVYGIVLASDKASLESEVEKLHNFLVTGLSC